MDMSKNLNRFLEAHNASYPTALAEISAGRKVSHWMWYIFPQLRGLGQSTTAWYYGIEDLSEAAAYLAHPVLGTHLLEITRAAMEQPETDPLQLFGWPDNLKFRSCLTLFALVSREDLFARALKQFFDSQADSMTLELLKQEGNAL